MANYFKSLGRTLLIAFAGFLTLIFSIWLLISLVVTLPYKLVVHILSKLFRADLIGFVDTSSVAFSTDEIYTKPTATLNYFIVLDGVIPLEKFHAIFQERIIDQIKDSEFVYKRFRQYWVGFMGYNFWKWDHEFDLNNHIKSYPSDSNSKRYTKEDLPKLMSDLLPQPYERNRSPWEIILMYNYIEEKNSEKMVLMFKIHHALADGFSLLNVLQHDLPLRVKPLEIPKANFVDRPLWEKLVKLPSCLFEFGSYSIASYSWTNSWVFPSFSETGKKPSEGYFASFTSSFEVSRVRQIKNKFHVSYLAVLITCFCEGVRMAMTEAGQTIPDRIGLLFIRPKPNHPKRLVNHWNLTVTTFPMHEMSVLSRLKAVEEQLIKERRSMVSPAFSQTMHCVEMLPTPFVSLVGKTIMPPGFRMSNFPVSKDMTNIDGCPVTDLYVGVGTPFSNKGAAIMMFGDGGKQSIVVTANQSSYWSQQSFEQLGSCIENALNAIETS